MGAVLRRPGTDAVPSLPSGAARHIRGIAFTKSSRLLVTALGGPYIEPSVRDELQMNEEHTQHGHGLIVEEARPQTKRPPLYQVILLNDDYTPMEFVVDVLEHIFGMDRTTATRVMLEVHTRGKGICGVFTYEIAETKVAQVTTYARQHQHPLLCTMEEA